MRCELNYTTLQEYIERKEEMRKLAEHAFFAETSEEETKWWEEYRQKEQEWKKIKTEPASTESQKEYAHKIAWELCEDFYYCGMDTLIKALMAFDIFVVKVEVAG